MKGIILAGGSGTRLYPITEGVSKQLLPVYDKPMIYYPISTLMLAGIKDILIITTPEDQSSFIRLLGDGSKFGINLNYEIQPEPKGLAQAFTIGEKFIGDDECAMVLGDNLFYGAGFTGILNNAVTSAKEGKASIFGYDVRDPERFGIMEVAEDNSIISVEEKPSQPKSNLAIVGLYFYPKGVSEMAKNVKPSARGEVEITTLNDMYLKKGLLKGEIFPEGFTWFDTGTFDSLEDAASTIRSIQNIKGKVVSCLEQIGYDYGFLGLDELEERAKVLSKNSYGQYLNKIVQRERKKYGNN